MAPEGIKYLVVYEQLPDCFSLNLDANLVAAQDLIPHFSLSPMEPRAAGRLQLQNVTPLAPAALITFRVFTARKIKTAAKKQAANAAYRYTTGLTFILLRSEREQKFCPAVRESQPCVIIRGECAPAEGWFIFPAALPGIKMMFQLTCLEQRFAIRAV